MIRGMEKTWGMRIVLTSGRANSAREAFPRVLFAGGVGVALDIQKGSSIRGMSRFAENLGHTTLSSKKPYNALVHI
jgi:hypothetical protein